MNGKCKPNKKLKKALRRARSCFRFGKRSGTFRLLDAYDPPPEHRCLSRAEILLRHAGAEFVDHGYFRDAYFFNRGTCVVKIPRHRGGLDHNKTEWRTWESASKNLKPFLLPVDAHDNEGFWLTMPRANASPYLPRSHAEQLSKEFERTMEKNDFFCSDQHLGNIGVYNGKLVSIDYGFGCEKGREKPKVKLGRGWVHARNWFDTIVPDWEITHETYEPDST